MVNEMKKFAENSKQRNKLTTYLIRLLRERATILCIQKKYSSVNEVFQDSLIVQTELYSDAKIVIGNLEPQKKQKLEAAIKAFDLTALNDKMLKNIYVITLRLLYHDPLL